MSLSAQQLAAQKNISWVLAEKLAQKILTGEYQPESILPGEMELGEQFGVSRTAVREAVKTLTAKGMLLPRPRIGTRVMPRSSWNFLDKELLSWWLTEDNFEEPLSRHAQQPGATGLLSRRRQRHRRAKSAAQYINGRDDCSETPFSARTLDRSRYGLA
jgi:DNA-binding FadR family transcriptional regulator